MQIVFYLNKKSSFEFASNNLKRNVFKYSLWDLSIIPLFSKEKNVHCSPNTRLSGPAITYIITNYHN